MDFSGIRLPKDAEVILVGDITVIRRAAAMAAAKPADPDLRVISAILASRLKTSRPGTPAFFNIKDFKPSTASALRQILQAAGLLR